MCALKTKRHSYGVRRVGDGKKPEAYPLHEACQQDDLERAKVILGEAPDLAVGLDDHGATALHCAAISGSGQIVDLLLSSGADVNARDGTGSSPLHRAASAGHIKIAESLIAHGAAVNAEDDYGYTPLQLAILKEKSSMGHYLISMGAEKRKPLARPVSSWVQDESPEEKHGNLVVFVLLLAVPAFAIVNSFLKMANAHDSWELSRALDIGNPSGLGILGWICLFLAIPFRPRK